MILKYVVVVIPGESKTYTDSDSNVSKTWKTPIKSIVAQGNPWIFFPDTQFKVIEAGKSGMNLFGKYFDLYFLPSSHKQSTNREI